MKKIAFILGSLLLVATASAQVAIGKASISSPSVSLEFGTANRGILLPWVTSAASVAGAVNGTLVFDTADRKVKLMKAGTWTDLSVNTAGTMDTSLQDALTENASAKVVIGANGSTATPGILVLADTDKAMVLPKVASPHLNIINPAAGMMAYDTTAHQLAVFNGAQWSFWKP